MNFQAIAENFAHAPVLFFFLGVAAVLVKSDLDIPESIAKFLGIYLLFHIGIDGGEAVQHNGLDLRFLWIVIACITASFLMPFISYRVLRLKLSVYNAGAIAATYGSVSAVTFATATSFLQGHDVKYGGYMAAAMALMESPAIIAGILLVRMNAQPSDETIAPEAGAPRRKINWGKVLHEALFNGSVFLLLGSMLVGYIIAGHEQSEKELVPFVDSIFKGMLSLYMLDMGLLAARRLSELKSSGVFLTLFGIIYPPLVGLLGIGVSYMIGLEHGDALLMTVLFASASYIAVPAAMRLSVPEANMSLLLPMALGITFTFNISIGIPMYDAIISSIWGV